MKVRPDANPPYTKAFFLGDSAAKGMMTKTQLPVQIDFGLEAHFGSQIGRNLRARESIYWLARHDPK
jgi:hypothetical protein